MMRKKSAAMLFIMCLAVLLHSSSYAAVQTSQLQRAWGKIASSAQLQHAPKVSIEDNEEPNAWVSFSMNQYSVHVTTGMLKILQTEDQIAGILGHETGHIKLGHYKETMGRNLLWVLLYRAFGRKDSKLDPLALGLALAESGFSRQQEVEADDYGIRLAARAGYDPWGLVQSLEIMKKAGYQTSPSGFNSHPPTERRLIHVTDTAKEVASH